MSLYRNTFRRTSFFLLVCSKEHLLLDSEVLVFVSRTVGHRPLCQSVGSQVFLRLAALPILISFQDHSLSSQT